VDVLEHLTQEHRMVEQLLAQLLESDEGSGREQLLSELESALGTHMKVEERFLYPIAEEVMGSEDEQEAETEHELARDGLGKLRDLVSTPGFRAAVEMVTAGIAHHVRDEEDEIFPELREKAGDELEALGPPEELESKVDQGTADVSGRATKAELYEKAKKAGIEGRSEMSKEELRQAVGES
jgi:iron-sulfur cluster repair protein YtfE (RIC family)